MSLPDTVSTAGRIVVGAGASTFPLWNDTLAFIGGVWPIVIQGLGLIVLVLTIRKLILENRRLDRDRRREIDQGGGK